MKKTIKTFALLGSGLLILSCTVVVVNQTAQVVQLAKTVHPVFGTATLWGLLVGVWRNDRRAGGDGDADAAPVDAAGQRGWSRV